MDIYNSIATRTGGNIYVGVVGPVRTGKSTFITRFMEQLVMPEKEKDMEYQRMQDELPQSGAGKQIMTMEPRFVPSQPVEVAFGKARAKVRLVDCVGYLIDGATGHLDETGATRMVKTPWSKDLMGFDKASELGTNKVIVDHSTVGVLVTTDGTITDIDRNSYVKAEERTVDELKKIGKPFVILLNSVAPESESTKKLALAMEEKYGATVIVKDVMEMDKSDFAGLFEKLLYEFPVQKIGFDLPEWMQGLDAGSDLITKILEEIRKVNIGKIREVSAYEHIFDGDTEILKPNVESVDLSVGEVEFKINVEDSLFFKELSTLTGATIINNKDLMGYLQGASVAKREYDKLSSALQNATQNGYGVVVPSFEEMELLEPEVVKKGATNGLRLKAKAPSLHIMRVDVESEVVPAVGGIMQSPADGADSPLDAEMVWNTSMFGKTMADIAHDGILTKLNSFPQEAEVKMRKTLSKITNEGKGGIICILL